MSWQVGLVSCSGLGWASSCICCHACVSWVALLLGRWLAASLMLWQVTQGVLMGVSQHSRGASRNMRCLWRPGPRAGVPFFCHVLVGQDKSQATPDAEAGAADPDSWWEKLQVTTGKEPGHREVWQLGPLLQAVGHTCVLQESRAPLQFQSTSSLLHLPALTHVLPILM